MPQYTSYKVVKTDDGFKFEIQDFEYKYIPFHVSFSICPEVETDMEVRHFHIIVKTDEIFPTVAAFQTTTDVAFELMHSLKRGDGYLNAEQVIRFLEFIASK
jgi:hypothetical protein